MTHFGYTLMTEPSGPKQLVNYAVQAARLGFDFEVSSDHNSPWLTSLGNAPYAWSVLGAETHTTEPEAAGSTPCGPHLDELPDAVRTYAAAGFTDVALVQVGDENQQRFLDEAAGLLLRKLRA